MACCAPVRYFFTLYTRNPNSCLCVWVYIYTIQLLLERKRFHVIGFVAALLMCTTYIFNIICCIISLGICRRDKQSRASIWLMRVYIIYTRVYYMGTDDIFGREKKNRNKYERKKRGTLTRARLGTINNNAMCIVHFTFNPFFSFS